MDLALGVSPGAERTEAAATPVVQSASPMMLRAELPVQRKRTL